VLADLVVAALHEVLLHGDRVLDVDVVLQLPERQQLQLLKHNSQHTVKTEYSLYNTTNLHCLKGRN